MSEPLYYTREGSGRPLVLLHGFLEDLSMYENLMESFPSYETIRIDLPGHGKSPGYDITHYSMKFMAEKVAELLEFLKIEEPIVIGHSMGGYVGLELLCLIDLDRLILFNSNFWADSEERKANRNRVIEVVKKNKTVFLLEAIRNLFFIDTEETREEIKKLVEAGTQLEIEDIIKSTIGLRDRLDHSETIEKFASQIEVVQAENDPIIPLEFMQNQLNGFKKRPELHIIQNSGHMSVWENPKATNRILTELVFK